jgi:hypothetical protein
MATNDVSIADLIKGAVRDAQAMVRGEIELAKVEARAEVSRLARGAVMLVAAALAAIIGAVLLLTTMAWAIADLLSWPVWSGFAIVTLLTLIAAGTLAFLGKNRIAAQRHMPRTVETLKENMEWIRARTS